MIGQIVSHYRILEKLGEGGMGVVYKAHDSKLDRLVALKFLPQQITVSAEDKARFLQEAKAISALNHPHIATIFDIDEVEGQKFLVLEYIPGGTLKSRLKDLKSEDAEFSIGEALDYGIQAAEALAHAHRHHIVHRDIKTDNLMLTEEGTVKLTDFGLAKLRGSVHVTRTGTTVGTAAYMSPEQIRGEEIDHRSDIFSLGVVLYELATSRLPFRGEFETALSYSILNDDPPPVNSQRKDAPAAYQKIIDRLLEKDKTKRYQAAENVVDALREVRQQIAPATKKQKKGLKIPLLIGSAIGVVAVITTAYFLWPSKPAASEGKSIAVLPFVDMSPQKDQEYFCDGMTEELISRLSLIKELKVPARTSVFTFKGRAEDIRTIGRALGVSMVLEGSIRKAGDKLKITAQLINVSDGYHLWSETYDRELKDVFATQGDIALAIAEKLKLTLLSDERAKLSKWQTDNPNAYALYLKGRYFRFRETSEDDPKALSYYQQAIKTDSQYALAWAGLADMYFMLDLHSGAQPKYHRQSLSAAERALELDSTLAEGLVAISLIQNFYEWDWKAAEQSYKRAIESNPKEWNAHREYGLLLLRTGRINKALVELQTAVSLDPLSWIANVWLGLCYAQTDNHQAAIEQLQKAIDMAADPSAYDLPGELGRMYFLEGSLDKAREEFKKASWSYYVWFLVKCGERKRALAVIDRMEKTSSVSFGRSASLAESYACVG